MWSINGVAGDAVSISVSVANVAPAFGQAAYTATANLTAGEAWSHVLVAAVELMGGEFQDVIIAELKEHTYYATLRVEKDGDIVEIDARPSDAIAVAITCEPSLPIYVAEEILENVIGS